METKEHGTYAEALRLARGPHGAWSKDLGIFGWKPSNNTQTVMSQFQGTFSVRDREGFSPKTVSRARVQKSRENKLRVRIFLTPPSLDTTILAASKAHQENMRDGNR